MEHGLKHTTFYVQNHIAALAMCYNPALVRDKPLGSTASVKLVYSNWYGILLIHGTYQLGCQIPITIHNVVQVQHSPFLSKLLTKYTPYFIQITHIIHSIFYPNYSRNIFQSSPVRARYGLSCLSSDLDCSAVVLYIIPCYIGARYNSTRLYYHGSSSHQSDIGTDYPQEYFKLGNRFPFIV